MVNQSFPVNDLKIFTDASTKDSVSCSAYMVIQNGQLIFQDCIVFKNVTNNFGELYAIMMALSYIYTQIASFRANYPTYIPPYRITVLSDSLYSVQSLTVWLSSWLRQTYKIAPPVYDPTYPCPSLFKKTFNKKTKKTTIDPVQNHEVILECMKLVLATAMPIVLMHTKAHLGTNTKSMIKAIRNHLQSNKKMSNLKSFTLEDFEGMIKWNNAVDQYARGTLLQALENPNIMNIIPSPVWPMIFFPTREQIRMYLSYIQ